jgi:lipopolysaccharide/colanic/teichoic acid biosynthesis glycosyltransferase
LFSAFALILLLPAIAVIAGLVRFSSPGPVIFSQFRYGKDRKLFRMYKFRTMYWDEKESFSSRVIQVRPNDPRLTPIGALLRRTSLDELPQFWNVLSGDMSVVGPRPHAPKTMIGSQPYEDVVAEFDRRHAVKPGITGLAQIAGFNGPIPDLSAAERRFQLDVNYVETASLWLDFRVIAGTIRLQLFTRSCS